MKLTVERLFRVCPHTWHRSRLRLYAIAVGGPVEIDECSVSKGLIGVLPKAVGFGTLIDKKIVEPRGEKPGLGVTRYKVE